MDAHKRLQKIADIKKKGATTTQAEAGLGHVHIQDGRAWACDGIRLYSIPTNRAACGHDCGWPVALIRDVTNTTRDLRAMVDVTHAHIKRAVKLGLAMYSGRTAQHKRESKGNRWLTLDANGVLDVSADSDFGRTTTTLEHGAKWNERWLKGKKEYRQSEVTYRKAGEDTSGIYEGEKLLDALMLMQDTKAERVELLFWKTPISDGITIKASGAVVLLMGHAAEVS